MCAGFCQGREAGSGHFKQRDFEPRPQSMKVYNPSVAGAEARGKRGQMEGAHVNHVKVLALQGRGGGPGKPPVSRVGGDMVRLAVSCGCPRYEDWARTGPEVGSG